MGIEKAGAKVRPSAAPNHYEHVPAHFLVGGEKISFSVHERVARFPHVPSSDDFYPRKYEFRASGRLRLFVGGHSWEDSPKGVLEDQINAAFGSVFWQAANAGIERTRLEERLRLDQAAEARRAAIRHAEEEKRNRQKAEEQEEDRRRKELIQLAEGWDKSTLLRRSVAAVREEAAQRLGAIEAESSAARWLKWAAAVADHLDPLPDLFGEKR